MNKKILRMFVIALAFLLEVGFVGCNHGITSQTYVVWTDVTSYTEFYNVFQTTLNDGYYIRVELSDAQWDQIAAALTNEGKNNWTEDQIYNYFIGRGFGQMEANQQKAWLMTIEHGFIASRTGTTVYLLLK